MRIGLLDVDGKNFPNLALMKLFSFHKQRGDFVSWVHFSGKYDRVYMSKIFTFTPDIPAHFSAGEIIKGGTGYDIQAKLPEEIENVFPDYGVYPVTKKYDQKTAYGFLTRGCIRKCKWCVVPEKEGILRPYSDIETVLQGRKKAVLMDNNILASGYGIGEMEKIALLKTRVDFNQGLDSRLVTDDIAKLLSKIEWMRYIRFACDSSEQLYPLETALGRLYRFGIKSSKIFVYCLLQDLQESYTRLNQVKKMGLTPFAQPYRDFTANHVIPQWQKDMARWCNDKAIFHSCDFKDYESRKGFKCGEYLINNHGERSR